MVNPNHHCVKVIQETIKKTIIFLWPLELLTYLPMATSRVATRNHKLLKDDISLE